jgi:hypothetical protein
MVVAVADDVSADGGALHVRCGRVDRMEREGGGKEGERYVGPWGK